MTTDTLSDPREDITIKYTFKDILGDECSQDDFWNLAKLDTLEGPFAVRLRKLFPAELLSDWVA